MYDMTFALSADKDTCLYEQIYNHIRNEITEGKFPQGEKLPSTRSLAEYLQVSRCTVDAAYDQLLSEGYIESVPCKGYFVCAVEELFRMRTELNPPKRAVVQTAAAYAYDFTPNGLDITGFPFGIWKRMIKNAYARENEELFFKGHPQGDEELRNTICRYLYASRGVKCEAEQIIVGAGNDYLLLLLEKILGSHVKMAMEKPTYMHAYHIFDSFGYDIVMVDMDEKGMKAEELERHDVSLAYVMPSHQYPTGAVMPMGRRQELLKWAGETEHRYLIEDDYDGEFRYKGKPIPALQGVDPYDRVIYIGTLSKAIAPVVRVSYMVLPKSLLAGYREKCYFYASTVSRIDQTVLNEFMKEGYFERHLNKMRKVYKRKHDLMLSLLTPFADRFTISGENAGLHLLLTDKTGRTEAELIQEAAKQSVKVYGLSESFADGRDTGTVILGYAGLQEEEIRAGMERLKAALLC